MKIINKLKWFLSNKRNNAKVQQYLKASYYRKRNRDKIKVAFIVQMPEVWDKQCTVFEEMKKDLVSNHL